MNLKLRIRPAKKGDLPKILALQKLAYRKEAEIYDDYSIPPLTQTFDQLEDEFKRKVILIAEIDGVVTGSVRAEVKGGTCYIARLIVSPDFQNRGIGTRLLAEIEKEFNNAARYELFTGEKSKKNIYLYRKSGYKVFKTEKQSDKVNIVYLEKSADSKKQINIK
jgi:ribosomal protein S18 acetylase RimI-like enzyme